jgi:hypothetical protein
MCSFRRHVFFKAKIAAEINKSSGKASLMISAARHTVCVLQANFESCYFSCHSYFFSIIDFVQYDVTNKFTLVSVNVNCHSKRNSATHLYKNEFNDISFFSYYLDDNIYNTSQMFE